MGQQNWTERLDPHPAGCLGEDGRETCKREDSGPLGGLWKVHLLRRWHRLCRVLGVKDSFYQRFPLRC
uniref:Alternative protein TNFRSF10A n=1 Tax=Homo sapiens TaxID=9606 RepID=L8EA63_HUMAN|nr:alternative protein TNFRSF10A [Homo sapiens]